MNEGNFLEMRGSKFEFQKTVVFEKGPTVGVSQNSPHSNDHTALPTFNLCQTSLTSTMTEKDNRGATIRPAPRTLAKKANTYEDETQ